jgi:hypothetical protein
VRDPFGFACPGTAATRQRGIVADWSEWGKRKMHDGLHYCSHTIHNFSTSPKIVHSCMKSGKIPPNFPLL